MDHSRDYRTLIQLHEGYSEVPYLDTLGHATIGYGHLLPPGGPQSFVREDLLEFFEEDMQQVERDYCWMEKKFALRGLNSARRAVLKNMLFNLGLGRLLGFKRMLSALREEDFARAAVEMLDSKWAFQVKTRALELSTMMRSGKWQKRT
jgi:lysozyme